MNKNSMGDQEVTAIETDETLKALISDLVRKNWNATRFLGGHRRSMRQRELPIALGGQGFRQLRPENRINGRFHITGCSRAHRRRGFSLVGLRGRLSEPANRPNWQAVPESHTRRLWALRCMMHSPSLPKKKKTGLNTVHRKVEPWEEG